MDVRHLSDSSDVSLLSAGAARVVEKTLLDKGPFELCCCDSAGILDRSWNTHLSLAGNIDQYSQARDESTLELVGRAYNGEDKHGNRGSIHAPKIAKMPDHHLQKGLSMYSKSEYSKSEQRQ